MDNSKGKSFGLGGYRGRVIFLGDGTEVLTDTDDTEMFDQEDKDLDSQVTKSSPAADKEGSTDGAQDKTSSTAEADAGINSETKPAEPKQALQEAKEGDRREPEAESKATKVAA